MFDPDFAAAHRSDDRVFTRQRILSFPVLVALLLCAWKGSVHTLLDGCLDGLTGCLARTVTKRALSQARRKLKASAFEALSTRLLSLLATQWPHPRWQGLRLVATDGTTLRLPDVPGNHAAFGMQTDSVGQPFVLARALGLYVCGARLMLKTAIGDYAHSENALLVGLLEHLEPDDLLVLDRGFPSVWLFVLLRQRGIPFLARIDGAQWAEGERAVGAPAGARSTDESGAYDLLLGRDVTHRVNHQREYRAADGTTNNQAESYISRFRPM